MFNRPKYLIREIYGYHDSFYVYEIKYWFRFFNPHESYLGSYDTYEKAEARVRFEANKTEVYFNSKGEIV